MAGERDLDAWVEGVEVTPLPLPPECDACPEQSAQRASAVVSATIWLGGLGHTVEYNVCYGCKRDVVKALERLRDRTIDDEAANA